MRFYEKIRDTAKSLKQQGVKENDKVKKGDKLLTFSKEEIKEEKT